MDTTPTPRPSNTDPEIKTEPMEEVSRPSTDTPAENPPAAPAAPKGSRMLKNLESNLDGEAWACNDTHRPRYRVNTTGNNEDYKYYDHWDNTVSLEEEVQENTVPADEETLKEG